MTGKEYAKKHGGNIGLEKAYIAGQQDLLDKIKRKFGYGEYYMNAVAFTKHQFNQVVEDLQKNIDEQKR